MIRELLRGLVYGLKAAVVVCLAYLMVAPAWAATYYVDTEATSNGDGSPASPWNALTNINTATIAPGDTVCIRGVTTGAGWTVPEAGTSGNLETYDFACAGWGLGIISATSGTAAVLANKGYTVVRGGVFQCSNCPAIQINASDVQILSNTIAGGDSGIVLTTNSERDRVVIDGNTVQNVLGNGSADASAAGVYLLQTAVTKWQWDDLTITNNTLRGNLQGGINLKCDVGASDCGFIRLVIDGNTVTGNANTGIVVQDCWDGVNTSGSCGDITVNTYADFVDTVITDNVVTGQTAGGGIAVYGLTSSTNAHGKNLIARNRVSDNAGVIGGIDLFNSLYVTVEDNYTARNTTTTIDANGILIDYGNRYTIVRRNEAYDHQGYVKADNSGCAVMILKGQDVDVYSNVGARNKCGLFTSGGDGFTESGITVRYNTWVDNVDYGWYVDNSQASGSVSLTHNIMTGTGTGIFAESSGAAQSEDFNVINFTTRSNFNGIDGWSDGANSVTTPARLVGTRPTEKAHFRLRSNSPARGMGACILAVGCVPLDVEGRRARFPIAAGASQPRGGD